MNMRIGIKHIYAFLLQSVLRRKLRNFSSSQCLFLTYHRVVPPKLLPACIEPGMYVTPSTFKTHIHFLTKQFEIVSIHQMESLLEGSLQRENGKPYCVISFDDGWRDFYTYAWPVLRDAKVPAIVYIPTGLVGTNKMFWTDMLALIIEELGVKVLATIHDDKKWDYVSEINSFPRIFNEAIIILKKLPYWEIDEILYECGKRLRNTQKCMNRAFMNWNEVRELYGSGLISFGSHTENHAILTTLSRDDIQTELEVSKNILIDERVVGECISFCYPNGSLSQEIIKLVKQNGYSSAVSCEPGWNKPGTDLFSLKRIGLHQDISSSLPLLTYRLLQYS